MIDLQGIKSDLKNLSIYINKKDPNQINKDLRYPKDEAYDNLKKWITRNKKKWILIWDLYVNHLDDNKILYLLPDDKRIENLSSEQNKYDGFYDLLKDILGEKTLKDNKFKVFMNNI